MSRSLTVKEIADQTGYTEYWIRHRLRQDKLTGSKRKGQWLVLRSSVNHYLNSLPKGKRRGRKKGKVKHDS